MEQGTANASRANIRNIRENEKVKLPHDLNQVSLTLRRFAILVHTLFQGPGAANPFIKCIWPNYHGQHQMLTGTPWSEVYPTHVLRQVQINVYKCLQALQGIWPNYHGQHQMLTGTPWSEVYPTHVLRQVQINVYKCLQALQVGARATGEDMPELPNIQELHRDLQRGCFHMSASWLPLPALLTMCPSAAQQGGAAGAEPILGQRGLPRRRRLPH